MRIIKWNKINRSFHWLNQFKMPAEILTSYALTWNCVGPYTSKTILHPLERKSILVPWCFLRLREITLYPTLSPKLSLKVLKCHLFYRSSLGMNSATATDVQSSMVLHILWFEDTKIIGTSLFLNISAYHVLIVQLWAWLEDCLAFAVSGIPMPV